MILRCLLQCLQKLSEKLPLAIAAELARNLGEIEGFSRIETAGGYLNFFTDKSAFARTVIQRVLSEGDGYGASTEGAERISAWIILP